MEWNGIGSDETFRRRVAPNPDHDSDPTVYPVSGDMLFYHRVEKSGDLLSSGHAWKKIHINKLTAISFDDDVLVLHGKVETHYWSRGASKVKHKSVKTPKGRGKSYSDLSKSFLSASTQHDETLIESDDLADWCKEIGR